MLTQVQDLPGWDYPHRVDQMLMMDGWTRFIVCWCSVRILHKCMSVMPWQEVFMWDGLDRKMRKAGQEWKKNGETDLFCSMKRSCLRVNASEWGGHQPLLLCMRRAASFNGVVGMWRKILRGLSPASDLMGWQKKQIFSQLLILPM